MNWKFQELNYLYQNIISIHLYFLCLKHNIFTKCLIIFIVANLIHYYTRRRA